MNNKLFKRLYIATINFVLLMRAANLEDYTLAGDLNRYPVEVYRNELILFVVLFIISVILLVIEVEREMRDLDDK